MNKMLLAIAIIFAGGFAHAQSYQPKSKLADFYKEANGNMIMILQVDNNYSAFDLRDEIPILTRNPKDSIIAFYYNGEYPTFPKSGFKSIEGAFSYLFFKDVKPRFSAFINADGSLVITDCKYNNLLDPTTICMTPPN